MLFPSDVYPSCSTSTSSQGQRTVGTGPFSQSSLAVVIPAGPESKVVGVDGLPLMAESFVVG